MRFTIAVQHVPPDQRVVTVTGELDLAIAGQLRRTLLDAVTDASTRTVTVDLAGVSFIDSSIVGALIAAHTTAARAGKSLTVERASGLVARVLDLVGASRPLGLPTS